MACFLHATRKNAYCLMQIFGCGHHDFRRCCANRFNQFSTMKLPTLHSQLLTSKVTRIRKTLNRSLVMFVSAPNGYFFSKRTSAVNGETSCIFPTKGMMRALGCTVVYNFCGAMQSQTAKQLKKSLPPQHSLAVQPCQGNMLRGR